MNEKKEAIASSKYKNLLSNLADYVGYYSVKRKNSIAVTFFDTGENISWKTFNRSVDAYAAKLLSRGFKKGDVIATSLPLYKEHIYLIYACYRTGIIIAPLDHRLRADEIIYSLKKINPKAYFFLGKTPAADFRLIVREVMKRTEGVSCWVQFQQEPEPVLDGAVGFIEFAGDMRKIYLKSVFSKQVKKARSAVDKRDPALIIFTTGSTGSPKPALLCHENILIQNIGISVAFDIDENDTMLVNLPPSHVGCVTEQLGTAVFAGSRSAVLHVFSAEKSMKAVEQERVTFIGQIPSLFNLEWNLPDYPEYDLSSLRFILYGGQEVPLEFLKKMRAMAPRIGTGLGLTETAGFCTYTDTDAMVSEIARSIGYDMKITPISIREPMNSEGMAGKELPEGEIGQICFSGPQVFIGYYNDPENTSRSVSKDGYCYTGDLGYYDNEGLHFAGRSKFIIKPRGFQVYPQDVVNHISGKLGARANLVACIGVPHDIYIEAIMAFIEPAPGVVITPEEVVDLCGDISNYSRPLHVEILEPGEMPLNRVEKIDYMNLKSRASKIIHDLREKGQWDKTMHILE